jgi:hypothetical protein
MTANPCAYPKRTYASPHGIKARLQAETLHGVAEGDVVEGGFHRSKMPRGHENAAPDYGSPQRHKFGSHPAVMKK